MIEGLLHRTAGFNSIPETLIAIQTGGALAIPKSTVDHLKLAVGSYINLTLHQGKLYLAIPEIPYAIRDFRLSAILNKKGDIRGLRTEPSKLFKKVNETLLGLSSVGKYQIDTTSPTVEEGYTFYPLNFHKPSDLDFDALIEKYLKT